MTSLVEVVLAGDKIEFTGNRMIYVLSTKFFQAKWSTDHTSAYIEKGRLSVDFNLITPFSMYEVII